MLAISPMVTGSQFINLSGDDMVFNVTFVTGTATIEAVGYAVNVWQGSTTGTINVRWEKIPTDITGTVGEWYQWWSSSFSHILTHMGGDVGEYHFTWPMIDFVGCSWPYCSYFPEDVFYTSGSSYFVTHTFTVHETGYYSIEIIGEDAFVRSYDGSNRLILSCTTSITVAGQRFEHTETRDHSNQQIPFPHVDIPKILLSKDDPYDIILGVDLNITYTDDPPWDTTWYIVLGDYPTWQYQIDIKGWEG